MPVEVRDREREAADRPRRARRRQRGDVLPEPVQVHGADGGVDLVAGLLIRPRAVIRQRDDLRVGEIIEPRRQRFVVGEADAQQRVALRRRLRQRLDDRLRDARRIQGEIASGHLCPEVRWRIHVRVRLTLLRLHRGPPAIRHTTSPAIRRRMHGSFSCRVRPDRGSLTRLQRDDRGERTAGTRSVDEATSPMLSAPRRATDVPRGGYRGRPGGRASRASVTGSRPCSTSRGAVRRGVACSHAEAIASRSPSVHGRAENSRPKGRPLA